MQVRRLTIHNFRGVGSGTVYFSGHTLLVGGSSIGKSTVCEALDLVLGPERLYWRPVVNEHDFHQGQYLDNEGNSVEIRIQALLVNLSDEAEKRFASHLVRWDEKTAEIVDATAGGPKVGDGENTCWALPVEFIGRYNAQEDDFEGNTFFSHPQKPIEELDDEQAEELGSGLSRFNRENKRYCGFVFLRTQRTGSRALSLQRGSLLDTILRLGEDGPPEMWKDTLTKLKDLDPAIGEIEQLKKVTTQLRARMSRFVSLSPGAEPTAFFASDLTREHLREVVRLFVASEKSQHLLPFNKMGFGTINVLVFALLTYIAELKGKQNVIFAMEEPEIALPPHTQRRIIRFVLNEMGQAIVTSHSPYVIEQFEPDQIVMLDRQNTGELSGDPIDVSNVPPRSIKIERRQFAESILSRAVIVVEGSTEKDVFQGVSELMERFYPEGEYIDIDYTGASLFNAGSDSLVPRYGPIFKALGKNCYAFYDKQKTPYDADKKKALGDYNYEEESQYAGIEELLIDQIPVDVQKTFLTETKERDDYPSKCAKIASGMDDKAIKELTFKVLEGRKGDSYSYALLLIHCCAKKEDLPSTICGFLERVHSENAIVEIPVPAEETEEQIIDMANQGEVEAEEQPGTGTGG